MKKHLRTKACSAVAAASGAGGRRRLRTYLRDMHTDVLVVGQGLCGTHLSWQLIKEGKRVVVVDDGAPNASSKVAAGLINPVTGRFYKRTWMAKELLASAEQAYGELEVRLGQPLLTRIRIIDFFPTPDALNTFVQRLTENDTFLHPYPDQNRFNNDFHYDFGCGEISPAFVVNTAALLGGWREKLRAEGWLREERFDAAKVEVGADGVRYGDLTADKLVFCEGIGGAANPWFGRLPFSSNKGEALIIRCEDLERGFVFKRGTLFVPLQEPGTFWIGSNYQWEFADDQPSEKFRTATTHLLDNWLKHPYTVLDHKAAVRPATLERRPFAGFHPEVPAVGLLNGTGTKGASLAPFFAHQMAQHIVHGFPLAPAADVHRFSRLLTK